jgi:hypothetical protein
MAMGYKARKRLALFILLVGLPIYVVVAVSILSQVSRIPYKGIEFLIYLFLGIAWVFPMKWVFKGIGQNDPDQDI